jgi:hypothetical protein
MSTGNAKDLALDMGVRIPDQLGNYCTVGWASPLLALTPLPSPGPGPSEARVSAQCQTDTGDDTINTATVTATDTGIVSQPTKLQ